MNFIDRVARQFGYSKARIESVPEWLRVAGESEQFTVPDRTLPEAQLELYQRLSWVQISVARLAEVAAVTKFGVKTLSGEDENEVINHPFEMLLRRPNPLMSRYEFLVATVSNLALTGNCYWWLNRASESVAPDELWVLPSNKVKPVPDRRMFLQGYIYEPDAGTEVALDISEVVHFRRYHPLNSFVGLSPIESFAVDAEGDLAMQRWNRNLFAKDNAKLPGALAFSDPIESGTWQKMKDEIQRDHGGTNRKLMMLRGVGSSVSWIPMAVSQRDMEFLSGRTFTKEQIFNIYAPGLASMLDVNATEANSVAGRATFIEFGVWPSMVQIAEKITNDILPAYGSDLVGSFEDIRVTDRQLALAEQSAAERVHTIDEVRQKFYKAKPIGDERGLLLVSEIGRTSIASEPPPIEPTAPTVEPPSAPGKPEQVDKPDDAPGDMPSSDEELPVKALRLAQVKAHTSVMVAFFMPSAISVMLADLQRLLPVVAEPVPASELHVTLTILGDAIDFDDARMIVLRDTIRMFLVSRQPLQGRLNGLGRFHNADIAGSDVIYASFDSKDLPEFRQSLVEALQLAGFESPSEYGYQPHVTLGYIPAECTTPMLALPKDEMVFSDLWLAVAGAMERFSFGEDSGVGVDSTPDSAAKRAERKAFRTWLKRRPQADIHTFKSEHLSHDELYEIASEVREVATEHPPFQWPGEITPSALKAMLLQLDPDDDEAEQKIRMELEKRTARDLQRAFNDMLDTLYPQGWDEFADPNIEAGRIHNEFMRNQQLKDAVARAVNQSADLGVSVAIDQLERVGFGFDWTLAHVAARDWAATYTDDLLRQLSATTARGVGQSISRWTSNGEPLEALIQDLQPFFGRRRAQTIAATEVTRAYHQGTVESYRQTGVISRLEWRTANDEKVCPICGTLHGKLANLGSAWTGEDGKPYQPPAHPGCRCWSVPYVDGVNA